MRKKTSSKSTLPGTVYDGELRTHAGNVGHYQNGTHLSMGQDGEYFSMWNFNRRFASGRWQFAITELNNGKWLSSEFDYTLHSDERCRCAHGRPKRWFDTREAAMRASVASLLRQARYLRRFGGTLFKIQQPEYEAVVTWLHTVLDKPAPKPYTPEPKPRERYHYLPEEAAVSVLSAEEAANPQLMLLKEAP